MHKPFYFQVKNISKGITSKRTTSNNSKTKRSLKKNTD